MTEKGLRRIAEVLAWYENTDGCEREQPAFEMYVMLTDIYNKEIKRHGTIKKSLKSTRMPRLSGL